MQGRWFHPRTLLDKTYEIGLIIKGFDGTMELLGALLLAVLPIATLQHIARVLHLHDQLSAGHNTFAIMFLVLHGAVKVALVVALLRQKLWAYPWALGALGAFLVYQLYLCVTKPSLGMLFLAVLDAVIIWLVWREWQVVRARHVMATQLGS